jgi:hypothetical protein
MIFFVQPFFPFEVDKSFFDFFASSIETVNSQKKTAVNSQKKTAVNSQKKTADDK